MNARGCETVCAISTVLTNCKEGYQYIRLHMSGIKTIINRCTRANSRFTNCIDEIYNLNIIFYFE